MAVGRGAPRRGSDGRRERWRAHREERRRELVQAAVEAVRRRGAGLGMDGIAEESGIAKQVFYRYFADKQELALAVGRSVAGGVVDEVTRAIEGGGDAHERLAAAIGCYLARIEAEPELYHFVLRAAAPAAGGGDPVADYSTMLGLQLSRLLGEQLRAVGADAGAAEPWGFALVGAVRSAADRWLANPTMSRDALCEYLTELAWRGLSAYVGAPEAPSRGLVLFSGHGPG